MAVRGPLGPLVWAQYRCFVNRLPQLWRGGGWVMAAVGALFYGAVTLLAILAGSFCARPPDLAALPGALARGLLLVTLYWQVVPLALSAQGVSLDLKRLRAFQIPRRSLFRLELALRSSASPEPVIVLTGVALGLALNPRLAWWAPAPVLLLVAWNLLASLLSRELLTRLWRRTWAQLMLMLALVLMAALPRLAATIEPTPRMREAVRLMASAPWPWKLTAQLAAGRASASRWLWLLLWCGAALWLARREFYRGMERDQTVSKRSA